MPNPDERGDVERDLALLVSGGDRDDVYGAMVRLRCVDLVKVESARTPVHT